MLIHAVTVGAAMVMCEPPADPVHDALSNIEQAGSSLGALTADVAYRKDDALIGGGELRTGRLVYAADPGPSLAVQFDYRIDLGDMARRGETKRLVFADGWLLEADQANRQFIKRQIVAPGDTADPMRLGGPFPLPIGQKRADVLRRFDVTVLDGPPDAFLASAATDREVIGLHLVPKPGVAEAEDWAHLNLWYDRTSWLPLGVLAVETNGDARRIRLSEVARHDEIPAASKAMLSMALPGEGWSVDVQPWQATTAPPAP
ncbi:MAG: hypothetical protein QF733_08910 [Phycisphaerales bacterium]|jgi:hypothetical protein|nr:hypothetical protein [Phycisphaerales bacterium]